MIHITMMSQRRPARSQDPFNQGDNTGERCPGAEVEVRLGAAASAEFDLAGGRAILLMQSHSP